MRFTLCLAAFLFALNVTLPAFADHANEHRRHEHWHGDERSVPYYVPYQWDVPRWHREWRCDYHWNCGWMYR